MRLTLLESNRQVVTWRAVARDAYAIGIEAALVTALVVSNASAAPERERDDTTAAQFLAPLFQPRPRPVEERLHWIGLGGPASQSAHQGMVRPDQGLEGLVAGFDVLEAVGVGAPPMQIDDPDRPLSEIEVDSAVSLDPAAEGPAYPESLLAQAIEGSVYARFVVDTNGHVDLGTFTLRPAADTVAEPVYDAFVQAVRDALPGLRYRPAVRAGHRVRQLVDQPFHFRIR